MKMNRRAGHFTVQLQYRRFPTNWSSRLPFSVVAVAGVPGDDCVDRTRFHQTGPSAFRRAAVPVAVPSLSQELASVSETETE